METERTAVAASFEQRLRSFCGRENITIEGRFPSFILAGFLPIEASLAKEECYVDGERTRSLLFDSIAPKVLTAIKQDSDRPFDSMRFLDELYQASVRAVAAHGPGGTAMSPIAHVFRELVFVKQQPSFFRNPNKKNFTEYSVAMFARDIARVLSSGRVNTSNGHRLDLGPASSSNDGIPVMQDGAIRIFGRLGFRVIA